MNKSLIILITAITLITTLGIYTQCNRDEHFTLPSTRPPAWYLPEPYQASMWLTRYNPDQLSTISCSPYNRGPQGVLNLMSSSYRFFRF